MVKAQVFVMLPLFMDGFIFGQYETMVGMMLSKEVEITCWPEYVQYLLTNSAQDPFIKTAMEEALEYQEKCGCGWKQFS